VKDPRYTNVIDIKHIDPHTLEEIKHFFKVYKDLQKKEVVVADWRGRAEAEKDIKRAFSQYDSRFAF
jgi:inorganic pyrophosphatase